MRYRLILIDNGKLVDESRLVEEVFTTDDPRVALAASAASRRALKAANKRAKEPRFPAPTAQAKPAEAAKPATALSPEALGVSPGLLSMVQSVIKARRDGGMQRALNPEGQALLAKLWTADDEAVMQARLARIAEARAKEAAATLPAMASPETSPATLAGPTPGGALNRS